MDFHYALLNDFLWTFSPSGERETERGFLACKSLRLHGNMSQKERTNTLEVLNLFTSSNKAMSICAQIGANVEVSQ